MSESQKQFYLVREDILTDAMEKTLEVKSLLESGKVKKINEAVHRVGLSRSAFYKYKDGIFPFHTMMKEKIITLSLNLVDRSGTLSQLLTLIAESGANILTINQSIPLQGRAHITLSINTSSMKMDLSSLKIKIEELEAVEKVELVGSGS
ncbi:ACT domain-containing protein [Alkalihalobacillus pseudalcaliphilus]|uniref:ACT domain-containing protein n=1 Tax=Alkalihalobacillus pseudalcaliphilus TaxID=79884 RepID=UPI00064DD02E|nr:ACT domain-containing protein [Alkalihalobacillus pseudalcaliphilus]KMK75703.1 ACT domain-containing protein [Alkalihalobacillus pseudalcaliphilus]